MWGCSDNVVPVLYFLIRNTPPAPQLLQKFLLSPFVRKAFIHYSVLQKSIFSTYEANLSISIISSLVCLGSCTIPTLHVPVPQWITALIKNSIILFFSIR